MMSTFRHGCFVIFHFFSFIQKRHVNEKFTTRVLSLCWLNFQARHFRCLGLFLWLLFCTRLSSITVCNLFSSVITAGAQNSAGFKLTCGHGRPHSTPCLHLALSVASARRFRWFCLVLWPCVSRGRWVIIFAWPTSCASCKNDDPSAAILREVE